MSQFKINCWLNKQNYTHKTVQKDYTNKKGYLT